MVAARHPIVFAVTSGCLNRDHRCGSVLVDASMVHYRLAKRRVRRGRAASRSSPVLHTRVSIRLYIILFRLPYIFIVIVRFGAYRSMLHGYAVTIGRRRLERNEKYSNELLLRFSERYRFRENFQEIALKSRRIFAGNVTT